MVKALSRMALTGVFALAVSFSAFAEGTPQEVVRQLTDEVIEVLRSGELASEAKRERIKGIVLSHVDFATMSRLILARNWKTIGEGKQGEFVDEFKKHLSVTYGQNVESYRDEVVTITGDRKEARGDWTVKTKIVRNGPNDIFVDYRLRKRGGEWKIIDVVIERVSLVSNFRSQFQGILSSRGIDGVLEVLREKNAEGTSGLKTS